MKKADPNETMPGTERGFPRGKKGPGMNSVLNRRIIGAREMRNNLSEFLDKVIHKKQTFFVGKLYKPTETATLLPTEILEYLVSDVEFESIVKYDDETQQYVASIKDLNADGVGKTPEDAVEMALDNVEALVDEFFANTDKYLGFERFRHRLPQYLKLKMAADRERMAEVLGFKAGD